MRKECFAEGYRRASAAALPTSQFMEVPKLTGSIVVSSDRVEARGIQGSQSKPTAKPIYGNGFIA